MQYLSRMYDIEKTFIIFIQSYILMQSKIIDFYNNLVLKVYDYPVDSNFGVKM